jgi:hypothetical protein
MEKTVEQFIEQLAIRARVLMIGGLAVIAHGLSRATKDADIWLEPLDNEALTIFERYADHITCGAALQNPDLSVRELGLNLLKEWAEKGDPFAVEVLKGND